MRANSFLRSERSTWPTPLSVRQRLRSTGLVCVAKILEMTMRHLYLYEETLRATLIRVGMAFVILALI